MSAEYQDTEVRSERTTAQNPFREGFANYISHVKLISSNARLFLLGSFLLGMNFQFFQLLLNLYLKEMGFAEGNIGLIQSGRGIGMTLMAIPAALILSRIRIKPVLQWAALGVAAFCACLATVSHLSLLILFMILTGMSFTFYRIAAGPFFMRNSTRTERTYLFSFQFASMLLAGMIGSIIAGRMAQVLGERTGDIILGYRYTLFLGIAIGALALMPYAFIKSARPTSEESPLRFSWKMVCARRSFYFKISVSNFLTGMGAGLIIPFLNLYFRDRFGMSPDKIGFYYFLVSCSMFVGLLVAPVLARKFGLVRTVVITQLLSIPFMLTLSYSFFLPLAVFAFVLRGGLMNMGSPMITNLGMELSDKHEQALVNALLGVAWTSSWMVSSALGGAVIEHYGYTFTLNFSVVIYVISTLTLFAFFRNAERRTDDHLGWAVVRGSYN